MWASSHAQRFEVFTSQRSPMQIHLMFPMGNNLGFVPGYTRGKYKSQIQITLPTDINKECTKSGVVALARLHPCFRGKEAGHTFPFYSAQDYRSRLLRKYN